MTPPNKKRKYGGFFWLKLCSIPIIFLLFSSIIGVLWIILLEHPKGPPLPPPDHVSIQKINDSTWSWKSNWYRKSNSGHHIIYVEGDPIEMGTAQGLLSKELITHQEKAFTEEIKRMIPSEQYLSFLQYFVKVLNKDLEDHILPIFQQEIKAISLYADDSFQWIGPNYARILNYHAAHDIGHALQNYMLVGCTSFSFWSPDQPSDDLWVARNFDFYVGDAFAEEKIILIAQPDSGHAFISVTWGGFIGVVSGMNEYGLSVTINAAPSEIPFKAATPVSLVAREVLQFAKNIEEAYEIIEKRKMFVSETFMIGSEEDKRTVIIEKTPQHTHLMESHDGQITCTNHFQSDSLITKNNDLLHLDATWFRWQRTQELMNQLPEINAHELASILRNPWGFNDTQNGLGNEKNINQFIAHHSVIINNSNKHFWVSTAPWQLGSFQQYDLVDILAYGYKSLIQSNAHQIPAASWIKDPEIQSFIEFYKYKQQWIHQSWTPKNLQDIELFIHKNPFYFYTWELAGDMALSIQDNKKALEYYQRALDLDIANNSERKRIENKSKLLVQ